MGQRSPDTAIAVAVEDGINHGPHLGLAWPPTDAGRRQERLQDSPLLACQITGVWLWVQTLSTFETPFWNRLLFEDEELDRDREERDPVAPTRPSASVRRKKKTHQTAGDLPVHSFQTLLVHLGGRRREYAPSSLGRAV